AESHAEEDRKKEETIDLRNQADSMIHSTEKTIKDLGDKVPEDVKKTIDEKVEALKKVKESNDNIEIKKSLDDLSETVQKIGAELYKDKQEQPNPEQPAEENQESGEEKVEEGKETIDADFEEKK
ncbi:MAG: Hsp70 family protein, partial [Parcubacteria group bacterium]|nr:Hsp70 family protein [Parcubacteria group bacterium]